MRLSSFLVDLRSSEDLSYTLDLATVIQMHIVDNIIDIQFLHGAGRIAMRKDTCRLDVVTLDVKERLAAFIWSRYFVRI